MFFKEVRAFLVKRLARILAVPIRVREEFWWADQKKASKEKPKESDDHRQPKKPS